MMKVTLQFHGDRQEICAMAWEWACESGVLLVQERFNPTYQARLVSGVQKGSGSPEFGDDIHRISLNPPSVDLSATSSLDFVRRNPDSLFITLGEQSNSILRESFLAAMTDDLSFVALWKKLRERARRSMHKGAWVENTVSGARSRVVNHYYTEGAKRLVEAGVIPVGGTDLIAYRFE
ncbi:hypothetical protein F8568_046325 [Actinomadura sp. LD22]|uniref:Uncharacterized protein n=1 Tax=Actinomadura physcomitrii TaxID=2650748 RepID=A0A6I4MUJ1_9ACTN|nr:hypothetical protein [Actinomadura physcomitrii]MWA07607.1 hypothetical protein [Actinomadura physcomitrii]